MIFEESRHKEKRDQEELQIRSSDNLNVTNKGAINHTVLKDLCIST